MALPRKNTTTNASGVVATHANSLSSQNMKENNQPANMEQGKNYDEDDDEMLNEDEINEYREMLTELGGFPDKIQINTLSMIAEDHATFPETASALYNCIESLLTSKTTTPDAKLPLVYVMDSILKNAKGEFINLIETEAKKWIPIVHGVVGEQQRQKLKKVLNTWREFGIFKEDVVKEMLKCYESADKFAAAKAALDAKKKVEAAVAGMQASEALNKISVPVRIQMQALLDNMHDGMDELEKISLERLAQINPDLLANIKQAALGIVKSSSTATGNNNGGGDVDDAGNAGGSNSTMQASSNSSGGAAATVEIIIDPMRSQTDVELAAKWKKVRYVDSNTARNVVRDLQHTIREQSSSIAENSKEEQLDVDVDLLVAASVTAHHITNMMQKLLDQATEKGNNKAINTLLPGGPIRSLNRSDSFLTKTETQRHVDSTLFDTDGLSRDKDGQYKWMVGRLYQQGLPFISSSDGRRFATQIELSHHLDELFRKRSAEKNMERTEERGWYLETSNWTGRASSFVKDGDNSKGEQRDDSSSAAADDTGGVSEEMVIADETRSKCAVCGITFEMFFDHDDSGEWMYSKCHEIKVLNDDAADKESENLLVHSTCWKALGAPECLTMDQVLQG